MGSEPPGLPLSEITCYCAARWIYRASRCSTEQRSHWATLPLNPRRRLIFGCRSPSKKCALVAAQHRLQRAVIARSAYRSLFKSPDRFSPENAATVTHGRSVIGAGAGDSRKIVVRGSRLKYPSFSSVRCPENDTKNAANHAVAYIGKGDPGQQLSCSTLLWHPISASVSSSKDSPKLTDSRPTIGVGKGDP